MIVVTSRRQLTQRQIYAIEHARQCANTAKRQSCGIHCMEPMSFRFATDRFISRQEADLALDADLCRSLTKNSSAEIGLTLTI